MASAHRQGHIGKRQEGGRGSWGRTNSTQQQRSRGSSSWGCTNSTQQQRAMGTAAARNTAWCKRSDSPRLCPLHKLTPTLKYDCHLLLLLVLSGWSS